MASALLWPSFKENYFKIWGSETSAGVSEPLFYGWSARGGHFKSSHINGKNPAGRCALRGFWR